MDNKMKGFLLHLQVIELFLNNLSLFSSTFPECFFMSVSRFNERVKLRPLILDIFSKKGETSGRDQNNS
jgi:hypothetical protein